jgi:hypothetical protein
MAGRLSGKRILVVEDECCIAADLSASRHDAAAGRMGAAR